MKYNVEALRSELKGLKRCVNVSELYKDVIEIVLNHIDEYDDPQDYFKDVIEYGCSSGIVVELITYNDTQAFFIKHMEDIFDIYNDLKNELGCMEDDLNANNLAWIGFEETIRQIADDIEIEY